MAKNFVQEGETIDLLVEDNTDAVTINSGDGFVVGSIFGVAIKDVAPGETGPFKVTGVWDLAKTTGEAYTVGQRIYWVASTGKTTGTAGSNKLIGVAVAAAESADTTSKVRLSGAFTI
jgi:predicted RecA/RadA family phage recombinase